MEPDFSKIYHHLSKDAKKGHPPIPLNQDEWPESWKTIFYKSYTRLTHVPLSDEVIPA